MLHSLYKPTECKTTLFHKCHHLRLWPSCFAFVSHPSATPSPHFLPGKRQNQRALWSLNSHVSVTPHLLDTVNSFIIHMISECKRLMHGSINVFVLGHVHYSLVVAPRRSSSLLESGGLFGDLERGSGSRAPPASAVTPQKSHIEAFLRMEP